MVRVHPAVPDNVSETLVFSQTDSLRPFASHTKGSKGVPTLGREDPRAGGKVAKAKGRCRQKLILSRQRESNGLQHVGRTTRRRPCLHCMMVELIDDFLAEYPPAQGGSDTVDTEKNYRGRRDDGIFVSI